MEIQRLESLYQRKLAAAGWGGAPGSCIRREYPITLGRIEGQRRRARLEPAA